MTTVADVIGIGAPFPTSLVKFSIGPSSDRATSMYQHWNNGTLVIDVKVFQRHRNLYGMDLEYPLTTWDDVVQALKDNGGLKMSYVFGGVLDASITLPMKLLSIESNFSYGPYEPVYDVLRFIHEVQHA